MVHNLVVLKLYMSLVQSVHMCAHTGTGACFAYGSIAFNISYKSLVGYA